MGEAMKASRWRELAEEIVSEVLRYKRLRMSTMAMHERVMSLLPDSIVARVTITEGDAPDLKSAHRLITDMLCVIVNTHPEPGAFQKGLDDGFLERMLTIVGPEVFDPNRRVRVAVAAREFLRGQPLPDAPPTEVR